MFIKEYVNKYYPHKNINNLIVNNHKILKVTLNSKKVEEGSIYCHIKFNEHLEYIDDAIKNGAKTIIVSRNCSCNKYDDVNIIYVDNPKLDCARLNKELYLLKFLSFPIMIGITGTTGKTSISTLIFEILKGLGENVLLINSDGIYSYNLSNFKKYSTNNTTPSNEVIYDFMSTLDKPYAYVIIEVSSQGVSDLRVLGIEFDYTIVTNFNQEHQEYYDSKEEYLHAKLQLVNSTKRHLIIQDNIEHFNEFITTSIIPYTTYGIENGDVVAYILSNDLENTIFKVKINNKHYEVKTKLIGEYNVLNIIAVLTLFDLLKVSILKSIEIIKSIDLIKGRMNIFKYNNRFIVVDYAHTKIALRETLHFLKSQRKNKLIVVIGAGGFRDINYRKFIGNYVSMVSDFIIFTEDNSREEDISDIINDIVENVKNENYKIIYNRQKAIDYAIKNSVEDDIIAIVGKGNEEYIISKDRIDFNDFAYIKNLSKYD